MQADICKLTYEDLENRPQVDRPTVPLLSRKGAPPLSSPFFDVGPFRDRATPRYRGSALQEWTRSAMMEARDGAQCRTGRVVEANSDPRCRSGRQDAHVRGQSRPILR